MLTERSKQKQKRELTSEITKMSRDDIREAVSASSETTTTNALLEDLKISLVVRIPKWTL